jgi:hypothetical protein
MCAKAHTARANPIRRGYLILNPFASHIRCQAASLAFLNLAMMAMIMMAKDLKVVGGIFVAFGMYYAGFFSFVLLNGEEYGLRRAPAAALLFALSFITGGVSLSLIGQYFGESTNWGSVSADAIGALLVVGLLLLLNAILRWATSRCRSSGVAVDQPPSFARLQGSGNRKMGSKLTNASRQWSPPRAPH